MGSFDIPKWLKGLPLAPEFHPTDTEFADPIAYISKIEKEASAFGICKVIPPLPKPSKRYVFHNLNKSLSKCPELGEDVDLSSVGSTLRSGLGDGVDGGDGRAVFTTRHQELGQGVRRVKGLDRENPQLGVHKQVWQSGEIYTLEQFESKSKAFARSVLGMIKEVNPLVIEALFWKAASERPINVEYANDVPGSGFAEPEGQFRYFRRQRTKRASYQSYRKNRENSDNKKKDMETLENSQDHEVKVASLDYGAGPSSETNPRSPTNSSSSFSEETSRPANQNSASASCDMVGTAGWKLSNSPWNLQVIARSPGSLTRFMPDDIPGVTSPMVYIGMLFSWFAWHVEDHELHSMNFLHTGSPKTWYAVPGEYAHTFEEVIHTEAYGSNIDHLAALTLLGEKTTLLSPDVIVSSGIPCCRLVQNPGEFVVTFPRAYHVGFSHGFNCGEAANFGTPQWLEVAKEAAVRRAAMNYLPMLSHQQLLYLLTMSFVSRVPRSLLPGVRCSRLRDRQREDRELSVKKAFIEDMLKENNILSVLLGRNSACRVVVWNADLLPSAFREIQLPGVNTSNVTIQTENASNVSTDCNNDGEKDDLFREMSLYMENLNGLYMDDDDLSCDFQMDSGTLACVACGILGFPFMCVIQPLEAASIKLPTMDHYLVEGELRAPIMGNNHADSNGTSNVSVSDDCACLPHLSSPPKDMPTLKGWSASCKFLRPQIFCLEHGIQIEELLRSKGGANMLVICHSDYQKIKAHAAAIAEEMCIPYDYHEVSLEIGSQEELNLIDLAIDVEDHSECGEDWTSVMGINLQYCVKTRKQSPSKQVQHALPLGGLLSEKYATSISSCIKWKSRRSRSKIKLDQSAQSVSCENVKAKKEEILPEGSEIVAVKQEKKLIQYMRRKFKVKEDHATNDNPRRHLAEQIRVTSHHDLQKPRKAPMIKPLDHEIGESGSTGTNFSLISAPKMPSKAQMVHPIDSMTIPIQAAGSPVTSNVTNPGIKEQIDNQTLEDSINKMDTGANDGDASTCNSCEIHYQMKAIGGTGENDISCVEKCSSPHVTAAVDAYSVLRENHAIGSNFTYESHNMVLGQKLGVLSDGDASTYWVSGVTDQHSLHVSLSLEEIENVHPGPSHIDAEVFHLATLDIEVGLGIRSAQRSNDVPCTSFSKTSVHQFTTSMEESCEHLEISPGESNLHHEGPTKSKNSEELILSDVGLISQPAPMDVETSFRLPMESCAAPKLSSSRTSEMFQEVQHCNGNKDQAVSSCAELEKNKPIHARDVVCAIPAATSSQGNLCSVTSDVKEVCLSYQQESIKSRNLDPIGKKRKRKKEVEQMAENKVNCNSFIRSPCEGLRPRAVKTAEHGGLDVDELFYEIPRVKERKPSDLSAPQPKKKDIRRKLYKCDLQGCCMSFHTRTELSLHKRNRCPYEGCKKRFSSHKYAMIHQRVHDDDRPLKCPWKGCSMTFKWAWARTEHIRVHTGEKPYKCKVEGCGRSFRFVSDFSRHRRRTGHCIETPASP